MNIGNIISEWEEDFSSVNDSPYFFLKKEAHSLPNPTMPGGVVIYFVITAKTLIVDGKCEPFTREMRFITFGLGNAEQNKNGDANRLISELEKFTNSVIQERVKQIKEWEDKGMNIATISPM